MEQTPSRPLAKRSRVALACNSCRHTKSKCDSERPCCGRCARHKIDCIYTPRSLRDKRLGRHEERRARLALIAAMPEDADSSNKGSTAADGRFARGAATQAVLQPRPIRQINASPGTGNTRTPEQESQHDNSPVVTQTDNSELSDTTGDNAVADDTDTADAEAASTIDMLATGAFDDNSESRAAPDIGYFGLSSNVALYRSLIQSLGYVGALGPGNRGKDEPDRQASRTQSPPQNQNRRRSSTAVGRKRATFFLGTRDTQVIQPGPLLAIRWITLFFDSVGAVLPYVHESTLLREISATRDGRSENTGQGKRHRPTSRTVQALLSIVFAYALAFDDNSVENDAAVGDENAYYRQALHLLLSEEQHNSSSGGGGTTVETVQALLLLGSYQQNSQRAMASLTSHALCVKASYQLGLHCRSPGFSMSDADKEMRATLWSAVVNQDRILSAAFGRPCLIPAHNTYSLRHGVNGTNTAHVGISSYFQNLSSLHGILGLSMDAVHAANLGLPPDLTPGELVSKTVEILAHLARWQETSSVATSQDQLQSSPSDSNTLSTDRHQIILSIYYHRTVMLTCGPVLMAVLLRNTEYRPATAIQHGLTIIQEASASILKTNLVSLRSFQRIMSSILRNSSTASFLKKNAVWWACNFSALTMCLHALSFWLIALVSAPMAKIIGIVPIDAEVFLLDTLTTLRAFGGSSIMSFKAHRCLQRHVNSVQKLVSGAHLGDKTTGQTHIQNEPFAQSQAQQLPQHQANMGPLGDLQGNGFPLHGFPEFSVPTLDDLLCQLGDNDFMSPISSSIGVDMGVDLNLDLGVGMGLNMETHASSLRGNGQGIMNGEPFLFDSI